MKLKYVLISLAIIMVAAVVFFQPFSQPAQTLAQAEEEQIQYRQLSWDDLMPNPEAEYSEAQSAKLVDELIGEKVSIPGFVVPLDSNAGKIYKFLFVPYMGACIHVPPPPPNQIIYAELSEGFSQEEEWTPIVLNGTLGAEYVETDIGAAGYKLEIDGMEEFIYEPPAS